MRQAWRMHLKLTTNVIIALRCSWFDLNSRLFWFIQNYICLCTFLFSIVRHFCGKALISIVLGDCMQNLISVQTTWALVKFQKAFCPHQILQNIASVCISVEPEQFHFGVLALAICLKCVLNRLPRQTQFSKKIK